MKSSRKERIWTDTLLGLQPSSPRDQDGRSAAQAAGDEVRQDAISDPAPVEPSEGSFVFLTPSCHTRGDCNVVLHPKRW